MLSRLFISPSPSTAQDHAQTAPGPLKCNPSPASLAFPCFDPSYRSFRRSGHFFFTAVTTLCRLIWRSLWHVQLVTPSACQSTGLLHQPDNNAVQPQDKLRLVVMVVLPGPAVRGRTGARQHRDACARPADGPSAR